MKRNALTAEQTARRLGVKLETVYAYVSRGLLSRTLADDGRTSRFDVREVEALARRGRPRKDAARHGTVDVSLATAITGIRDDRLLFRGHDATHLAQHSTFEAVAELLWSGVLPSEAVWPAPELRRTALPKSATALDRLPVAAALLASKLPLRVDLRRETVIEHARLLMVEFVAALPAPGVREPGRRDKRSFAAHLFPRLSALAPTPARVALLNSALILLADHELATSTLAARVAASTRADPFAVVLAGLGAVSGPLHGKAAVLAQRLLLDAAASSADQAVARIIAAGERIPGFGHRVYHGIDPRAAALLAQFQALGKAQRDLVERVAETGTRSTGLHVNVDFALAALAHVLEMPLGSTEAIFAIARTAGWIAHALEEYDEEPLRFRARSIYVGADAVEYER